MAGGVTLSVRQIGSYPLVGGAGPGDLLLMQPGGLGNPYASVDAATLVQTALSDGSLGVGQGVQPGADVGQIFTANTVLVDGALTWNAYAVGNQFTNVVSGFAAALIANTGGWNWLYGNGLAGGATNFVEQMQLDPSGALKLNYGTLTVARDPGSALEVATMGYVGANTVGSFNGRRGVVTLNAADIYAALCPDSLLATETFVCSTVQASIQMLLTSHPFVFGWNGRVGAVWLTLADINCVFLQPGQQPMANNPPVGSDDNSIATTSWVVQYIQSEFGGSGTTLATQTWVLANTVNSFNGRQGPVTLTTADVIDVGAAPLNSPNFSGIPTAPTAAVGQATGQIATTAFVQMAISHNTAGVSTFNTRTGDVVLETADLVAAGGLTNPSANLTGAPSCPTAAPGTSTPQIANTQFVMAAIAAGTVTSFNTRTGAVVLTLADVTGVGGAPIVSPAFSSVPTAPTAAPGTNTVQLATTAFVQAAVTAAGGVSSFNGRTGVVDLIPNDISGAGGLVNPSVNLTGSPTATTATAGDNSTRIATTAFVATALSAGAVTSFNTRSGAVTLVAADITGAGGALLAGPAFTGAPTAPTAAAGTNNTQLATTQFVASAILANTAAVTSFNTRTGAVTLTTADITGAGGAPLASPSFTGTPLGPTATPGTSTTQLATTAFVENAIASSGVSSFNSRTGAVTLIANDLSAAGGALLAGPTFTGVPAAPTAAPGTNTTQLATTAFVTAAVGSSLPLAGGTLTGPLSGTTLTLSGTTATTLNLTGGGGITTTSINVSGLIQSGSGGNINTNTLNSTSLNTTGNLSVTGSASIGPAGGETIALTTFGNIAIGSNLGNGVEYSRWANNAIALPWNQTSALRVIVDANELGAIVYTASDANLKDNFGPIAVDCLAVLGEIGLQQFDWKPQVIGETVLTRPHASCGFTAQDLQPLIPEAVIDPVGDGPLSVDTLPLIAYLIGAVQQLSARMSALDGKSA